MNRRERLERCYFHQELDRPGVFCRTGFPGDDPTYDRLKAYLAEHTELKRSWHGLTLAPTPTVESRLEPYSEDFQRQVLTMHTPAGDLEATRLASLKGQPGLAESYYIKCREDAEKYLSLPVPEVGGDVSGFAAAMADMGDEGIIETGIGMNPAGTAATLCGSETFAIMSITDRDVLHALCQRRTEIAIQWVKYALAHGVGPFFAMAGEEYVAPPLHGARDFEDFNVRYDKQIIDVVHDAGGRVHIHCHGSIKKVMPGFVASGVDVLHPFEPPPMGDITPAEAKELARGQVCLEGNIQIGYLYEHTPEEIREETEALIDAAFDDRRGLIVCPTASPYIRGKGEESFPRFKAMIDAGLNRRG